MRYCESPYFYHRRKTREIVIGDPANGGVIIGGDHPVVKQSMLTCDTMDTALSRQANARTRRRRLPDRAHHRADGQGRGQPARTSWPNCARSGCHVPIVADIHFKPDAAMEAAKWVEMVRVNPGNYADKKKFAVKEYTDEQYAAELKRIEEKFTPLVLKLQET